ncbi:hypothetical protein [Enterovibrio sp. 27052020O]|uniref:hypothetical protein n=1 Tax=Enterovibrio sp. 27052020O TaxID=3241166 RepID=UPI0038903A88
MFKVITDKDLVKDIFQSFAYFVFIAGLIKLSFPVAREDPLFYGTIIGITIGILFVAAAVFAMLHVVPGIVEKYYAEFRASKVEEGSKDKRGYLLFGALCFPYLIIGLAIVHLGYHQMTL